MDVWAMHFGVRGRGVCLGHISVGKGADCMFGPYQSG